MLHYFYRFYRREMEGELVGTPDKCQLTGALMDYRSLQGRKRTLCQTGYRRQIRNRFKGKSPQKFLLLIGSSHILGIVLTKR